jgi:hypothetical protein
MKPHAPRFAAALQLSRCRSGFIPLPRATRHALDNRPAPPRREATSTTLAVAADILPVGPDDEGLGGAAPRRPARRLPQAGVPRGHARRGARLHAVA